MIRHLRRHVLMPDDDGWWLIRCDCGWEGRTPGMARQADQIDHELEQVYRGHIPAEEARTHLRVDAREPEGNLSLAQWLDRAEGVDAELTEAQARAAFAGQPRIIGTFIMPIGEPVMLIADREVDGVHNGTYRTLAGEEAELPIGEVTTPEGRVFRLDE